jgi:prolyl 4-hydroxylase
MKKFYYDYFRKLDYWQREHRILKQDVTKYITSPLNAFKMIKRATADISLLTKLIPSFLMVNELEKYRLNDSSLTDAVKSLLLLQRIYKLPINDIARGYIKDYRIGDQLSPHDLYVLGSAACNITNEEFFAKKYLELAHQKLKEGYDKRNEIDGRELLMKIAKLCERMNDYKCSAFHIKQILLNHPDDDNRKATEYAMKIVELFNEHGTSRISFEHPYDVKIIKDGMYSRRKEFELVSDVCRGKLRRNVMEMSRLRCRYASSSPFTLLAPFRMEEVNLDPYIVTYLNVLSHNEIQSLRKATIRKDTDEKSIFDVIRMASLYDNNNVMAARISRRIEVISKWELN